MSKTFDNCDEAVFRSAEMSLIELFIPLEISRDTVYSLGDLGLVQFRDLNKKVSSFQRSFVKEIRRLDEVQRQYRFFKSQLKQREIALDENPYDVDLAVPNSSDIDDCVENAQIIEQRVNQLVDSLNTLEYKNKNLVQNRHILKAADEFLDSTPEAEVQVEFVTGIISREKLVVLEKILWRTLRGNLFFKTMEIDEPIYEPETKQYVAKNAFIIFTHGQLLISKIKKISESLGADLYEIAYKDSERTQALIEVNSQLTDITAVLETTDKTLQAELIALSQELPNWDAMVIKEKLIYESLNLFDYDKNRKVLIAEAWAPTSDLEKLKYYLKKDPAGYSDDSSNGEDNLNTIVNILSTTKTPPTFHRVNKFTSGFQAICDAYGIATYQEVNPGLATVITFPFMFALMFGDLGHGLIMAMIAGTIVYYEGTLGKMKRDDIVDMAYGGRYIVLFMGLFSLYTGLMYNDLFSISMSLFKTGWKWPEHFKEGELIEATQVGVYGFGIDSAWHGTENGLLFLNSYKMKLSIVMGYLHMLYSYMFSLVNYIHFSSTIDIIGNFIPGFLFMNSIFGYLTVTIIYKWTVDWVAISKPAPSLLNTLISMFLAPGTVEEQLFPGQAPLQVFLVVIALICVPCLLFIKPLYMKREIEKKQKYQALHQDETAHHQDDDDDEESGHAENFGDIMIHQVIHTIEFCLNCVSHTASYLRLWALSLAHAQLSQVLWSMTLANSFGSTGVLGVFMTVILFGMWFVLTCCVLVAMEGTSAMLHSLRLHWVESMSKFFEGNGYAYQPFSFKSVLEAEL